MSSWEMIEKELKKCVLLCCRCHREVHDGLHPGYLEDETTMRGAYGYEDDERQVEMFDESWVDPNVTPEQIREAMEKPTPFDVPPLTMLDLLAPLD